MGGAGKDTRRKVGLGEQRRTRKGERIPGARRYREKKEAGDFLEWKILSWLETKVFGDTQSPPLWLIVDSLSYEPYKMQNKKRVKRTAER